MKDLKKENLNDLVPELLGKTRECANNLQDRVKINGIFSEFDAYTHENFQKFIDMSQQRYKSIKSGNHLQKKLESQKLEYNDISSQILSNRFYNNNEIERESKKLLKKMNQKQNNKEISELRKHIIQKTKDFTLKEVVQRERLASAALARRKKSELDRVAHRITRRDLVYRPESMKKRQFSKEFMPVILDNNTNKKKEIDEYLERKKFFDDLMENDCKNINENIADYKDFVKDIERTQVEKKEDIVLPGTKKDNYGHTFTFLTDGIKMLSFKEEQIIDNKPIFIEEPKIDIIKLMRYTKRGNKKWFQEELKKKSVKRLNELPIRPKSHLDSKNTIKRKTIYENNEKNSKNMKEEINKEKLIRPKSHLDSKRKTTMCENNGKKQINMKIEINKENEIVESENINNKIDFTIPNKNKSNSFSNFKNTIKTVRNEAEKAFFLDENFDKKKDTMDALFNNKLLPKIEDYENLIQKNAKQKPKLRKNIDIEKTNEEEYGENKNKKDNKKSLLRHEINSFSKKKLTWTREDFLREQSKKKDKNVLEETKKYLKEIKEVQKKANKEESINQCINIFNKYLSEHNDFYKKKNNVNNKKPIKKNINKNMVELQNKKEEEKKKKKEEERINYLELLEKMRENLEKEEDEEDIQLNFQYKLYKGFVKETNLGLNAYNDYLELLEIAKERKLKGDYDYNNMVENKGIIKKTNAYNKFISNFAKINTYVDSDGKLVKYNNPMNMFKQKKAASVIVKNNIGFKK